MSAVEDLYLWHLGALNVVKPQRQYRFHRTRKWRFDFAWPDRMLAAEIEGGTWVGGRHVTGVGFEADCQKMSAAAADGWRVLRLTTKMVETGYAVELTIRALAYVP